MLPKTREERKIVSCFSGIIYTKMSVISVLLLFQIINETIGVALRTKLHLLNLVSIVPYFALYATKHILSILHICKVFHFFCFTDFQKNQTQ